MSDMNGVHTCIVTKSKPWTIVSNTFQGSDIDVLKLCQVKLVYLGNDKFGRLIPKDFIGQSSYVHPNFNAASMLQPVQPASHPTQAVPMLVCGLETANTLLDLHGTDSTEMSIVPIEPENTATPSELPDNSDAMDKIVGYCEEPNLLSEHDLLKSKDAMDLIVSTQPDDAQLNVLNVETITMVFGKQDVGLNAETMKLKACHVCVRPLENLVFDDIKPAPPVPTGALPIDEHYTRSPTRKPAVRMSHIPRKASTGKQYKELVDTPSPMKRRPIPAKPSASGPSVTRISAQKKQISVPD